MPAERAIQCFKYGDEAHYDLFSWIDGITRANGRGSEDAELFKRWVRSRLIVEYAVQREQACDLAPLCGLSIFLLGTAEIWTVYKVHPFHKACRLGSL